MFGLCVAFMAVSLVSQHRLDALSGARGHVAYHKVTGEGGDGGGGAGGGGELGGGGGGAASKLEAGTS